jgi:RNase P subunit RPR2
LLRPPALRFRFGRSSLQSIRRIDCSGCAGPLLTPLTASGFRAITLPMKTVVCIICGKIIR